MKIRSGFAENLNKILDKKGYVFLILLASAVLTALTMIFEIMSVFAFVSLAPLVIILIKRCENGKKVRSSYGIGFVWSFFFYIVIYHWFWYLWPMDFLGIEKPLALVITLFCWIGLSLLQAVGTAFVAPLFCLAYKKGRLLMAPFIFASAWTVLEYMQSLTWMGVPWARLALSQTAFPAAVQTASLFGSLFIGFIIALVNGFIAVATVYFVSEGKSSRAAMRFISVALAVVMLNLGYGFLAMAVHNEKKGEEVTVTVVQGNISS
ncbi:MAG: hypothetical protein II329_04945, partial [Clostridia bacterium]|nr:hypothetical protein [Clostridia bacterium]